MKELIEAVIRRYAPQVRRDGLTVFVHDGDPLMRQLFDAIGWEDGHPVEN